MIEKKIVRTVAVKHRTLSACTSFANLATGLLLDSGILALVEWIHIITFEVIWPESVTPFRYAMSLVDGDQAYFRSTNHFNETFVVQTFRCNVAIGNRVSMRLQQREIRPSTTKKDTLQRCLLNTAT